MEHGEERNFKKITKEVGENKKMYNKKTGERVGEMPGLKQETFQVEKWCKYCQEWITCTGIVENLVCKKCNNPF